jgi:uracil-DNA glycosylase
MSSLKRKPSTLTNGDAKKSKQDGNILSFFKGPKESVSSTAQAGKAVSEAGMMLPPSAAAPINFDKPKWITTLTAEQKELLKLELDTMDDSWLAVLKDEIKTPEFLALKKFLAREQENGTRVFPPKEDIYSW